MKIFTFAGLGIVLLLGTDLTAAAVPLETSAPTSATLALSPGKGGSSRGGWLKRKKRRITPAYRRAMRHR